MDRFLQLFGRFVQFSYATWDRIVLRGYYERLQRPDIVYFFRNVCGERCITPQVLAARTVGYRRWVENYAKRHAVPLITPPAGTRKEQFVDRFYQRYRKEEGVVVILKSKEQSPTFISYEPRYRPASGDDDYRLIKRASKRFPHYYFYVMDPVMGPMSLCVASYLPFGVNCYMHGHSYLAQHLQRAGIRFRKDENAIVNCADPERLAEIAAGLDEAILSKRADYWALRLAPSFSDNERSACRLQYQWSMAQMEFARTVIFRRRARLHELFQRATEIGVALGGATQTRHIFGRRIDRRYHGKLEPILERRDEGFPVLRSYYQRRLAATTDRYLAQQAELLDSTVDTGALTRLASPITIAARRVPGIKLHDERGIRLLETLLHSGGLVGDWTTRDLHERVLSRHRLGEQDYTIGQLRYDLGKLRAHGLAERLGTSRRYRLSRDGVRLGALLVKVRTRLLGPIFADQTLPDGPAPTPIVEEPFAVWTKLSIPSVRSANRSPSLRQHSPP